MACKRTHNSPLVPILMQVAGGIENRGGRNLVRIIMDSRSDGNANSNQQSKPGGRPSPPPQSPTPSSTEETDGTSMKLPQANGVRWPPSKPARTDRRQHRPQLNEPGSAPTRRNLHTKRRVCHPRSPCRRTGRRRADPSSSRPPPRVDGCSPPPPRAGRTPSAVAGATQPSVHQIQPINCSHRSR